VVDVVPAPRRAAVARQPEHRRWLRPAQGLGPLPVLRPVTPHVHLHRIYPWIRRNYTGRSDRVVMVYT
jgi:hypothetical protein